MNKVAFPLKPGDRSEAVANLQDALLLLIDKGKLQLSDAERQSFKDLLAQEQHDQVYKDGTAKAVAIFQKQHQLDTTGEVDDKTAAALNDLLRELGAFDSARNGQQRVVAGQVLQEDERAPFKGTVILFTARDQGSMHLGDDATDPEGRYSIGYDPALAPDGAKLRVAAFDSDGTQRADATFAAARPLEIVNLIVPRAAPVYRVAGTVASRTRAGVGGLRVQIVDKNVGADVPLGEVATADDGSYVVTFPYAGTKQKPDLQARVLAGERFLGASEVRYNATPVETRDVLLPDKANVALASEHETLTSALSAHVQGSLRDLQETDERQDITYLANKTGWDARAVALAALSDQFSTRTTTPDNAAIDPAFFYALFRAGLPANEDVLYQADSATVQHVWEKAAAQGVLPQALAAAIPEAVQRFQALSAQKLLSGPALVGASSLQEMLTASRLDAAQQTQFAELYAAHRADTPTFWDAVSDTFGQDTANRLQVDGKLGFLTINNAPLMAAVHTAAGDGGLNDPLQLAQQGYASATKWYELLTDTIPIPQEIAGATPEAKQQHYADYMAAQVRLSYPTAAVAHMVQSGDLPLPGAPPGASDQVHAFLTEHHGQFEIGMQPVQQYVARNQINVAEGTLTQIQQLQRVYQITSSDQAMTGLMKHGLDAAYHVARYDKTTFVQTYGQDLGGAERAALTYDRSMQMYNAVLNVAVSYITAKNGISLGAQRLGADQPGMDGNGQILRPQPTGPTAENAADVIAYPTLEGLFGAMDFCACDHCRSVLSPAAYLVDLLLFIDQQHPPDGTENPQTVLLDRRPDIQHLPLTCENTNTALPYIDVVNETLEYFIANSVQALSLHGYVGHDTDGAASADLLASPQFVIDAAYTTLRDARFPAPLPFNQPLETLRRYFDKFGAPLPRAMERLRTSDDLERGTHPYGWRDILMEDVGLSRDAYEILTDSGAVPLWRMYGFASGTSDGDVIAALSNAKDYSRRVGITYDDLVTILPTRFINPNSDLIPKLERLGVPFATLKALKDGTITDAAFDALLPQGAAALDPAEYGGDVKAWLRDDANFARIMALITLTDPQNRTEACDFGMLELRFATPLANADDTSTRLGATEFVRLLRFIRLWKKLGWTIEQTDAAICALSRTDLSPLSGDAVATVARLDTGFLTLLPRLGIVARVMTALNLTPRRDLLPLLACWSDIGTHGAGALYRQMFLNPTLLKQDAVFADNGFGEFLTDSTQTISAHSEALRAAFHLTGDEYEQIVAALGYDANTPLTLPNSSAIFRRGWLARTLKLSIREVLLLITWSGLDPFAAPDPPDPAILRLIAFVQSLKARSLKTAVALSLIWNQDLSGTSAPDPAQIAELARTLRGDFAAIDDQLTAPQEPGDDIGRAQMALVYGQEAADAFFGLLDDTVSLDVAYTHPQPALEAAITAADAHLAYDDFRHRLAHTGVLSTATRDALNSVAGVTAAFQDAVDALFARSADITGSFFGLHPELQPLYDSYVASADPVDVKRNALLAAFRPELARRRKRPLALQRLGAAAGVDLPFTQTLLDAPAAPYPLHASGHTDQPALNDVLALETPGLAAQFFANDTATGTVIVAPARAANLEYAPGGTNPLPANPTAGAAISGIWSGQVETPEPGFYNVVVEADSGATVKLTLDGVDRPLTQNGTLWRNTDPLELQAGTLYDVVLTVEKVNDRLKVTWETPKRAREVIPARYLYPPTTLEPFSDTYIRFLKAASLAGGLRLTANELASFATHADYQIDGDGWLNALPVRDDPATATAVALLQPLQALLDYARIKAALSPGDDALLRVLHDPATATAHADSILFALTRWDRAALNDLLAHFGGTVASLAHFAQFRQIYDAFDLIQTMGIAASALIKATTNAPDGNVARAVQAALRARYDAADWRAVVQPINDALRGLQRDALVASILHQMRANLATAHIDTPDKLFEYFLMDVQMEPCMQTSRIRHALSTVQLFVERCLMNLEPRVSPAALNAKQWEWMKRYRVWEANRKVFLWPENWLEPELRDDKSPFFKEIESELLQSDITEDSATTALLNYLAKLEEVAKLEPCGIYHVAADASRRTGEIDHVIARTAGAHRKYYYRRREYGTWTPWEQVKLDIEDNPVMPVVWNDRLLLFWLRILKQGPVDPKAMPTSSNTKDLAKTSLKSITEEAKSNAEESASLTVQAVLCWSEYYNGKWQPTRTSDVDRPLRLGSFDVAGAGAFDRSLLNLVALPYTQGALRIIVADDTGAGASFFLHNAHSLPELRDGKKQAHFAPKRNLETSTSALQISYPNSSVAHSVLENSISDHTVEPHHPINGDAWDAPFFYEDARHVFFVTTADRLVWVSNWHDFGIVVNPPHIMIDLPPLVLEPVQIIPDVIGPVIRQPGFGVIDPAPVERYVTEDAYISRALGTHGTVSFGDKEIGPAGSQVTSLRTR